MLGLGQQVSSNQARVSVCIGDHQCFGRPWQGLDANHAIHGTFSQYHEQVARPGDLINLRHTVAAIGHSSDCLGTAKRKHPVNTSNPRRRQHNISDLPGCALRWRTHNDFFNTGDPRRNRGHQQRRRQRRTTARCIQPDATERHNNLAQRALGRKIDPRVTRLLCVKTLDFACCQLQCIQQCRIEPCHGCIDFCGRDFECRAMVAIQLRAPFAQCCVAAFPHILNDAAHRRIGREWFAKQTRNTIKQRGWCFDLVQRDAAQNRALCKRNIVVKRERH